MTRITYAMGTPADIALASLPDTFRYSDAARSIGERRLREMIAAGQIASIGRGAYRKRDWRGDEDLAEIALKAPRATLCLGSALARHGLADEIPSVIDVAIPRGSWTPGTQAPVRWRHFDAATFDLGREAIDIGGGRQIGLYSPERSIVDAFRLRHVEGAQLGNDALKRWLRQGGQPSALLRTAKAFPRAESSLRRTLEILL